ncbi:hypothetical protein LCGC14_2373750, partial [marine sediment metagenome]
MNNKLIATLLLALALAVIVSCSGGKSEEPTVDPEEATEKTVTPATTPTPFPTRIPEPTSLPNPPYTRVPVVDTPTPTILIVTATPTETPIPIDTPTPTIVPET